jgi:hypothetical protein
MKLSHIGTSCHEEQKRENDCHERIRLTPAKNGRRRARTYFVEMKLNEIPKDSPVSIIGLPVYSNKVALVLLAYSICFHQQQSLSLHQKSDVTSRSFFRHLESRLMTSASGCRNINARAVGALTFCGESHTISCFASRQNEEQIKASCDACGHYYFRTAPINS